MKNIYNVKIRTKEGTYEYEKVDLQELDLILMKHPIGSEMYATRVKEPQKKKELVVKKGEKK